MQCISWKPMGFTRVRCTNLTAGKYNYCDSCKAEIEKARPVKPKSFWSWFGF